MEINLLYLAMVGLFLSYFGTASMEEKLPIVEISLGKLEGYYKTSYGGRKFAAFEGIPYAKPPIGDLRFEPPQELQPWTGVWKANKVHTCLQTMRFQNTTVGDEDCLYINVYVPENATDLDVVVHFHGGAFMNANPELGGPGYLMDRNIVYVNMNYRLGPFGFLSTEDAVVPGNMGLKDQSMSLSWIQKHIKNFGGNPDSVTIIGPSAGSACVHLHYFSPLSKGLFHKGISQGGTALVPWALHKSPLKTAKKLAATIGCDNLSTVAIIACLKNQTGVNIVKNVFSLSGVRNFPLAAFAPVIENRSPGAFLSDCPHKLLKAGRIADVPWIIGSVTEEGVIGLLFLSFKYDYLNENWYSMLDIILNYEDVIDNVDKYTVAHRIKRFYLNGENVTDNNVQNFIKLFGDRYFYLGTEKAARLQAKAVASPVYSYIYGYKINLLKILSFIGILKDHGVMHGSDSALLYTLKYNENVLYLPLSKHDGKVKELLLDMVTSFAKTGKPAINGTHWNPIAPNSANFRSLLIGNDELKPVSKPELAYTKFWKSLPIKECYRVTKYDV